MVSKHVLLIQDQQEFIQDYSVVELLRQNASLHEALTKYKDKITEPYKNRLWDRYKKLSNEYEMIFTTPNTGSNISTYCPVSRSFFKMWEMLHDFKDKFDAETSNAMNVLFLAEGPGGFAEAVIKYRGNNSDKYYGISLKSVNKNIPDWKYQDKLKISYGKDGTGDLYKRQNLEHLIKTMPKMDIITADGGFDFSNDFNGQEESSLRLILCEIYCALHMQVIGGNFILKIYDVFNEHTLKTLSMLKKYYNDMFLVKPLSSRPANSEKYIVCCGFNGKMCEEPIMALLDNYNNMQLKHFFDKITHNPCVLHNVVCYNIYYTLRQILYIEQTIQYITEFGKNFQNEEIRNKIKAITERHKQKAVKWCQKYHLDHVLT
jgi:23S rRNA U2552 (ribose-2'-O)-methylase RlmE/FtsJ